MHIEYIPTWSNSWKHEVWIVPRVGAVQYKYYDGLDIKNSSIRKYLITSPLIPVLVS